MGGAIGAGSVPGDDLDGVDAEMLGGGQHDLDQAGCDGPFFVRAVAANEVREVADTVWRQDIAVLNRYIVVTVRK